MKLPRFLVVPILAGICFAGSSSKAAAQVSISIGVAPVCPYGYFNYAPYSCAPFGYYGPQWYSGGVFIGAGPWFRGPVGFRGYVDRSYDPRFGYRGAFPVRGERADWGRHRDWEHNFHGNEFHEEHRHDNGNHYGHYKDHDDHGRGHADRHEDRRDNGHGHGHDR
jgi:hypothetical protein